MRSLCCRIITIATRNPNWRNNIVTTKQGKFSLKYTGNWLRILIIYLTDKRRCLQAVTHVSESRLRNIHFPRLFYFKLSFLTERNGLYIFVSESKLYSFFITVKLEVCRFLKFFPLQKTFVRQINS